MSSTNLYNARRECDRITYCHMFYDSGGSGKDFYACENPIFLKRSIAGSMLYQVSGNKENMQYK